jgi:hypothetical protein
VPVYGLVILDTPEELVAATLTSSSWTTVNSTTLNTATAKKAILRFGLGVSKAAVTTISAAGFLRKTGSGLAASDISRVANCANYSSAATTLLAVDIGETIVNLDTSYDFDYYYSPTAALGTDTSSIWLVGYYA